MEKLNTVISMLLVSETTTFKGSGPLGGSQWSFRMLPGGLRLSTRDQQQQKRCLKPIHFDKIKQKHVVCVLYGPVQCTEVLEPWPGTREGPECRPEGFERVTDRHMRVTFGFVG